MVRVDGGREGGRREGWRGRGGREGGRAGGGGEREAGRRLVWGGEVINWQDVMCRKAKMWCLGREGDSGWGGIE